MDRIIDSKSFGSALKTKRKEMGLTQTEFAKESGFSQSFISDLENGKATAEIGKAIEAARLLGLDITISSNK